MTNSRHTDDENLKASDGHPMRTLNPTPSRPILSEHPSVPAGKAIENNELPILLISMEYYSDTYALLSD